MAAEQAEAKIIDAEVLLIYGVGEHSAVDLEESVARMLTSSNIAVLDWTRHSWVPLSDLRSISYAYLADLLKALGTAARRSVQRDGRSASGNAANWMMDIATAVVEQSALAIVLIVLAVFLWCLPDILLPLMPVTVVPVALSYLKAVWIAAAVLDLLASLALLFVGAHQRRTVNLQSVFRRLVFLHLRPFLHCALLPLTVSPLLFALPLYLLANVTHRYPEMLGAPPVFGQGEVGLFVGVLLIVVARYGPVFAQRIIGWLLGPTRLSLKILADVVMYLGDSDYRESVLNEFQKQNGIDPSKRLRVIVAHSLGSVIAADGLRMASSIPIRTILVTMGSPLAKWFYRFFSADYPAPDVICQEIKQKGPLNWVNVFRPHDPVGTSLSSFNRREIFDIDTNQQCLRKMDAHADYFTDPLVRDLVVARVAQLQASGAFSPGLTSPSTTVLTTAGQRRSPGIKTVSALLTLAVYLVCMANTWVWFPKYRQEEKKKYITAIESAGAFTDGVIVRAEDNEVTYDNPITYDDAITYKISFKVPGRRERSEESNGPFFWLNEGSTSGLSWSPPLTPISSHYVPFYRVNSAVVQVRYLKSDPTQFYIPRVAALTYDSGFRWRQIMFSLLTAIFGVPMLWLTILWLWGAYLGARMPGLLDDSNKYGARGVISLQSIAKRSATQLED